MQLSQLLCGLVIASVSSHIEFDKVVVIDGISVGVCVSAETTQKQLSQLLCGLVIASVSRHVEVDKVVVIDGIYLSL